MMNFPWVWALWKSGLGDIGRSWEDMEPEFSKAGTGHCDGDVGMVMMVVMVVMVVVMILVMMTMKEPDDWQPWQQ